MAAPLSSGIGTGGAQVYTGTLAYDALKDLLQQQRQDKEKLEAKREKAALKNEKDEQERQTYIRGELGKVYNTDAKMFFARDGETLIPEITESASEFLNQPGVAKKLYKGDVETTLEWNKIKTGASSKIQKSVEDKVKSQEIMPEYNRWKSDPDNYDGEYYPEDFENFENEIKVPGSDISGIGKKINIDDFKKKKTRESWSLWSQIQKEAEKGNKTGKSITEADAVSITDEIYTDPSFIKGLRHRIRKENLGISEDEMAAAIVKDKENYLNEVKKWTTERTAYVSPGSGPSLTEIDKVNQRNRSQDWVTRNLTVNPDDYEHVGDDEAEHLKQKFVVPKRDGNGDIVYTTPTDGKQPVVQMTSLVQANFPEFRNYKIQKLTPQFAQIRKALMSTQEYSRGDLIFPVKAPDGTIKIGVVDQYGATKIADIEDERESMMQSSYVTKIKGETSTSEGNSIFE